MKCRVGIRPIIDGRWGGIRESLEEQTMNMAISAKKLIEEKCFYIDGSPVECVISDTTIGGSGEAAQCAEKFNLNNVTATLSVTPCWCYGSETMDIDSSTIKAVWGFNGSESPGAVYLAAVQAAHAQKGLPAFSIYGQNVLDKKDKNIPEDVKEKIIQFVQCAMSVGQMKNKSYVNIGSVAMGIMGSYCSADFFQKYLGIRPEWVDMTEVYRRINLSIYDQKEYEKALEWSKKYCLEGVDNNTREKMHNRKEKDKDWEFVVKMTLICRDILLGNPVLKEMGWNEEGIGRNAIAGGFQGQRQWTDFLPNGDFTETILNTSFDWNGARQPLTFATENDTLNAVSMLFQHLLTGQATVFSDVRTYWSAEAVERVTKWKPTGTAKNGFIHLINSGASALDGCGRQTDNDGNPIIKRWWDVNNKDIDRCLNATKWCPANLNYFRGGGFSSQFITEVEMPVTMCRINIIDGLGPVLQICEGFTVDLPKDVKDALWQRTDPTWPCTWFAPILTGKGSFTDVYSVMANWGSNHGAFTYGHIGHQLITLASMLRIPVSMHNIDDKRLFRPHSWAAFGTMDKESADYRACKSYGPLYK